MLKPTPMLVTLFAATAIGPAAAYGQDRPSSTANQAAGTPVRSSRLTEGVLATVNGVPIGEADVRFVLNRVGQDDAVPSEHRKNILEVIIRRELIRQRAVELGLNSNPRYQEKLRRMEAQINAFKREKLSELFFQMEIAARAEPTEAEVKNYFAENASRIRTELHVWQILLRNEGLIEQALSDIEHGMPFEEVAGRRFPGLPKTGGVPWDLGYLRWKQIPKSWCSAVYDLKKGEVSGVIRGPKNRFWLIKLIDKRENQETTFESIKPTILDDLKNSKVEELGEKTDRDLRAEASIIYSEDLDRAVAE